MATNENQEKPKGKTISKQKHIIEKHEEQPETADVDTNTNTPDNDTDSLDANAPVPTSRAQSQSTSRPPSQQRSNRSRSRRKRPSQPPQTSVGSPKPLEGIAENQAVERGQQVATRVQHPSGHTVDKVSSAVERGDAVPEEGKGGKDTLRLRLDLNLEIEVELKAKIKGDLTLGLL